MRNTRAPVLLDIYTSFHSAGLRHDVDVIKAAVKELFADRVEVRAVEVPYWVYNASRSDFQFPAALGRPGHIAIFLEHAFVADFLREYRERAIFINPEWFNDKDRAASEALLHTILHKSRYYHELLEPVLTSHRHVFTGFTSLDPGVSVVNYERFSHFRGRAKTRRRMTQVLVNIWRERPDLPLLRIQAYGEDIDLNTLGWVGSGNLQFHLGELGRDVYWQELAQGGIHICTSRVEGFGHFANEARAMSALTIALDAPPVNELITTETGILVPASEWQRQHLGTVFTAEPRDVEDAIDRALSLSMAERERVGRAARALYEQQATEFKQALFRYLKPLVDDISISG